MRFSQRFFFLFLVFSSVQFSRSVVSSSLQPHGLPAPLSLTVSWSLLKFIPEYSLEGLMLKLKLQHFGHLMRRTDSLEKTLMLGKI